MKRIFLLIGLGVSLVNPVLAETILFESGTLGQIGATWDELVDKTVAGSSVNEAVFNGVRFELTESVITSEIGGHYVAASASSFFGAIVELENISDFPNSSDLMTTDVLGAATLTFPELSGEVFGSLVVSLDPGWYALVFGSGLFETSGRGAALRNNLDIGEPSYINYQDNSGWINWLDAIDDHRFVVKGMVVPEPSTYLLALLVLTHLNSIRFDVTR